MTSFRHMLDSNKLPKDRRPNAVSAAPLTADVSLTLVRDAYGWRFYQWTAGVDRAVAVQPTDTDRELRFATPAKATEYFKSTYAALLRSR